MQTACDIHGVVLGYREYKSDPKVCEHCPYLSQCTRSKAHVKMVTRHVWQEQLEEAEENRYYGLWEYYQYRKETIERIFALAKELHGFRYTQGYGRAQMEVKAALIYACLNLKKLAKKRWKDRPIPSLYKLFFDLLTHFPIFVYQTRREPDLSAGLPSVR